MNKSFYRLVFNPARGLSMPVAEIARSRSKTDGGVASTSSMPKDLIAVLRPLVFSVLTGLGMVSLLNPSAWAQVVADPSAPGNQQALVTQAANGVPVVNIQTPSAAGVSRNVYNQFDVGSQGVILNNARTNTATQLGGWIQGNPYLPGGPARVILNEVNSANPSQLLGYIEVGGSRAQVVIANPAGITCDGCGFINTSRATLTTGTPILNGGNLEGYRVQRGLINVQGAGLDARQSDYTDIIARAVIVNAGLWAQQLSVTTGVNQVNAAHTLVTPLVGSGATPGVAIDVATLGGMYAGKITLVSTEAGVGVHNAGQIGATAGDVVITAEGRLQNSGQITSVHNLASTTAGLSNSGTLRALDNVALTSVSDIDNTGVIAAGADLAVTATSINNQSALLNAGGTLSIQTHTLDNSNTLNVNQGIQANSVSINANLINNTLGTISANTNLALTSNAALNNTQGLITAGQTLSLADAHPLAKTLAVTNTLGTLLAGQNLQVDSASLSGDGSLRSPGDINVKLASDFVYSGEMIAHRNVVFATSGTFTNQASLQAGNALNVNAANIDNTVSGAFTATSTRLTSTGLFTNRGLIDGSDTFLTASTFNNLGNGRIYGDPSGDSRHHAYQRARKWRRAGNRRPHTTRSRPGHVVQSK
jgi:filamentous hemagglutinin